MKIRHLIAQRDAIDTAIAALEQLRNLQQANLDLNPKELAKLEVCPRPD